MLSTSLPCGCHSTPWLHIPIFNKHTFRHDMLHMLDHHGLSSFVLGEILHAHVSGDHETDVLPGATIDARLAFLNADIDAFYKTHHVKEKVPKLAMSNLKSDAYPELHGNGIKAATTRMLAPYAVSLQQRATTLRATPKNKHMQKVAQHLKGVYDLVYTAGTFLNDNEKQTLAKHLASLGVHYQWLQAQAYGAGLTRWKNSMKVHYVCAHMHQQADIINPRVVQGYVSESMVGQICGLYKGSRPGHTDHVQRIALIKYRAGMQIMWLWPD